MLYRQHGVEHINDGGVGMGRELMNDRGDMDCRLVTEGGGWGYMVKDIRLIGTSYEEGRNSVCCAGNEFPAAT